MQTFYFKVKLHHRILMYIGSLNTIYVIHIVAFVYLKRTHVDISVAEALVHGPVLITLFI